MNSNGAKAEARGPTEKEVDAAIQAEAEMAAEQAAPEGPQKMSLEDWQRLDTPEWDPTKFKLRHLKEFIGSLPQPPKEEIPEDHCEGRVIWEMVVVRIGVGQKFQGPHSAPAEGEEEHPPELPRATLRYAYNVTFPCPTEESIEEKKLKKPGVFSRYEILMLILDAVSKTNSPPPEAHDLRRRSGRKNPLLLRYAVVFQALHSSPQGYCLLCCTE